MSYFENRSTSMDTKKQTSVLTALIVCVVFVTLLSFFMPLISIEFIGTFSLSGFDVIEKALDDPDFPELGIVICFVSSIVGLVCSLAARKNCTVLIGTILSSAAGMIFMFIAVSDDIDYIAAGFYLYEIMHFAAIVMSVMAINTSKSISKYSDIIQPIPTADPKTSPKRFCPKCGAPQEKDAHFCRFCGTQLSVPVAPLKTDRNAICPHCGARQSSSNTNCKYCGTPMH